MGLYFRDLFSDTSVVLLPLLRLICVSNRWAIKANLNSKDDRENMCVGLLHIGVHSSLLNIATA
jgi:hypothetical protein